MHGLLDCNAGLHMNIFQVSTITQCAFFMRVDGLKPGTQTHPARVRPLHLHSSSLTDADERELLAINSESKSHQREYMSESAKLKDKTALYIPVAPESAVWT